MDVGFPYRFDLAGRTAAADLDRHIRDLIEQVLFTAPGERVNRPTFGSGVNRLVFAPNSAAAAPALQLAIQGALLQWLGEVIQVDAVDVVVVDSSLTVTVRYIIRQNQERRVTEIVRSV